MSEQYKDIVRRGVEELWNQKKLELFDQIFHPDFRNIGPGPYNVKDFAEYREFTKRVFTSFPDLHFEIQDLIAEGDSVAMVWRAQGTFKANWRDLPANEKLVQWLGVSVYRIHDGKIKEHKVGQNDLEVAQVMGLMPALAPATR